MGCGTGALTEPFAALKSALMTGNSRHAVRKTEGGDPMLALELANWLLLLTGIPLVFLLLWAAVKGLPEDVGKVTGTLPKKLHHFPLQRPSGPRAG